VPDTCGGLPLFGIGLAAFAYAYGLGLLRGRAARERAVWRAVSFYAGLGALVLALEPPVDRLADELFWAHMLLQLIAPPLIVLGAPLMPILRMLPAGGRRRLFRWLSRSGWVAPARGLARFVGRPLVAWLLFNGVVLGSHLPVLFELALRDRGFHEGEHALFVGLGLLFWSRALDSPPLRARVLGVRRFVFFFSAAASEWLLALAILAAHGPLYDHYAQLLPRPEHLSTLADQQFGAGLMLDPLGPLALAAAWALKVVLSPPASGRRRTRSQHACVVAQPGDAGLGC